jgi:outer membrane receptor protein involved in Fe transport
MAAIWEPENRFRIWFEIEAHACDAQAALGIIPKSAAREIWRKGKWEIDRIDAIERETKHDVIAFLTNLAEHVGPAARFQKTARIRLETGAAFVENTLDLAPKLRLVTGLRSDAIHVQRDTLANPTVAPATAFSTFHKRYRPWTGRAGVVYEVSPALNAYAAYSTAAEPVTQLVSFGAAQANFSLQQGRQWEAGVKGSLLRGRADFTLALFDIEKTDLLSSTLDAATGQRISQQIGAQTSQGV